MSDHEHDQEADVAGDAADLLDRLRAALDPPDRLDVLARRPWRLGNLPALDGPLDCRVRAGLRG